MKWKFICKKKKLNKINFPLSISKTKFRFLFGYGNDPHLPQCDVFFFCFLFPSPKISRFSGMCKKYEALLLLLTAISCPHETKTKSQSLSWNRKDWPWTFFCRLLLHHLLTIVTWSENFKQSFRFWHWVVKSFRRNKKKSWNKDLKRSHRRCKLIKVSIIDREIGLKIQYFGNENRLECGRNCSMNFEAAGDIRDR